MKKRMTSEMSSNKKCNFCGNDITNGQYTVFNCFANRDCKDGVFHYIHSQCKSPKSNCPLCFCKKCHQRGLWHTDTFNSPRFLLECPTCHARFHRRCCSVNCIDCGHEIPNAAKVGWSIWRNSSSNKSYNWQKLKRDSLNEINSDMLLSSQQNMQMLNKSDLNAHDLLITIKVPWSGLIGRLNFTRADLKRWWDPSSFKSVQITWQQIQSDLHLTMADIVDLQPKISDLAMLGMNATNLQSLYFSYGHLMKLPSWMMPDLILMIGFNLQNFTPQLNLKQIEYLYDNRALTKELAAIKSHTE